jgi:hypothetical protein
MLTDFFKFRAIQSNINNSNKGKIDNRLDCFHIGNAWNKGNFGNLRNLGNKQKLEC